MVMFLFCFCPEGVITTYQGSLLFSISDEESYFITQSLVESVDVGKWSLLMNKTLKKIIMQGASS